MLNSNLDVTTVAVLTDPKQPLAGALLGSELQERISGIRVTYPPNFEDHVLNALNVNTRALRPEVLETNTQLDWTEGSDFLLIPHPSLISPDLLFPLLERGMVVIAPLCEHWLPARCYHAVPPNPGASDFVQAVELLVTDNKRRDALVREGRALARRVFIPPIPKPLTPPPPPKKYTLSYNMFPQPEGVSVIIPTAGGARVHHCIQALRRAALGLELQIILVVTGGLKGSLPPCDEVVRSEPPFVWSAANNSGLRFARYPLILFLNDDCYFKRDGDLRRLVERLRCCNHLIAIGPRMNGCPPGWPQARLPRGAGVQETRFTLHGACFLVRREAFDVVGSFDERFTTYGCDEVDWFYRARGHGYSWAVDAAIEVDHEAHATFGARRDRELPISIRLFHELHGVLPDDGPHWNRTRRALSWVIASRNNAGHLARCLGSIAAVQHLYPTNQEVLLALDNCTDASEEIAKAINTSFDQPIPLRIVSFSNPAGSSGSAKNRALRLALGDVHLPMDDDDATTEGRAQLFWALDDKVDVVVGNYWTVDPTGRVTYTDVGPISFEQLARSSSINWGLWASAIRRETWAQYGMHTEGLPNNCDLELWLRWLRDGVRFRHLNIPTHLYLQRPGSVIFRTDCPRDGSVIRAAFREGRGTPPMGLQAVRSEPPVAAVTNQLGVSARNR